MPWQQLHSCEQGSSLIPPTSLGFFFWLLQTSYMHRRASLASLLGKLVDQTQSGDLFLCDGILSFIWHEGCIITDSMLLDFSSGKHH